MKQIFVICLAFAGGVFLAVQAALNSHLGLLLKKPLLATVAQSASGLIFSLLLVALAAKELPAVQTVRQVPAYLWFMGGLFSVLGVSLYYFAIPRLGLSTMISLGLSGQLVFAIMAGHYGWLNVATEPLTLKRLLGIVFMLAGILLIKLK
ncbi:EamA-like transporter family protein [Pedobacter yulinensis]|uniref:EamA-like transporter family protein n=1 Tax=Pedobacter yulinensis TaxID=2126353 RepID=A0A2T3HLV8_9SPHI|nr:DMT family transporter [Pedobacter yulinensis]PST83414.1 EamA-like transporter family protein [Pedobacter yulinensis]